MVTFETKNKLPAQTVQPKLKIGKPGDKYEQEADAVADRVMRMPGSETMQMQPMDEEEEEILMKPFSNSSVEAGTSRDIVTEGITKKLHSTKRSGSEMPENTTLFMSKALNSNFDDVKIHTDSEATQMTQQLRAKAFTIGNDIYFNEGQYNPATNEGKRLLAHELTHVIQQGKGKNAQLIQKDDEDKVEVRSPVFEETVTQVSNVESAIRGTHLNLAEIRLARSVFGNSIDYTRVRLIPTRILQWRTVANTIRVPDDFTIKDSYMAETFIHEMTHVWQYQHQGTSYISTSLSDQIAGIIRTGDRNAAYEYTLKPGKKFFDYRVEQQAYIVQTYFNLVRERANRRTTAERRAEIDRELVPYRRLIAQMRSAMPRREADLIQDRAIETTGSSNRRNLLLDRETVPEERRMTPIKPLLEIRF